MDVLYQARVHGLHVDDHAWSLQRTLLDFLEGVWDRPDNGIWEMRSDRRHFTHSKVLAWVAFDRAVRSVERLGVPGPADRWRRVRDEIHAEVCREGFNSDLNSFTQSYGSTDLDASTLLIPLWASCRSTKHAWPGRSPRCSGT
jgi:GH15 family glucan-1,4-alpha-glucosidase